MAELTKKFTIEIDGIDQSIKQVDALAAAMDALNKAEQNVQKTQAQTTQQADNLSKAVDSNASAVKKSATEITNATNKQKEGAVSATAAFDAFYDKLRATPIEGFDKLVGEAQRLDKQLRKIGEGLQGREKLEELNKELDRLDPASDKARKLAAEVNTLEKQIEALNKTAEAEVAQSIINQVELAQKNIEVKEKEAEAVVDQALFARQILAELQIQAKEKIAEAAVDPKLLSTIAEADLLIRKTQLQAEAGLFPKGSIQRNEREIQALNETIPKTTEEANKIIQSVTRLQRQIEATRIEAEKGIFPPGSIGALQRQAQLLQSTIETLPQGTKEFNKVKKELDDVNRRLEVASLTLEDQVNLYFDLGASIGSAFAGAVGTIQSFAGDNEDVNRILAITQQTLTVIETIRSVAAAAQVSRRALLIRSTQQEIAASQAATQALNEEADATDNLADSKANLAEETDKATDAQENANDANQKTTKGSKGAAGGIGFITNAFSGLGKALKANPILAIAGILLAIGTALVALRDKIKPVDEALKFLEDTSGGIKEAFLGLLQSGDSVLGFLKEVGNIFIQYLNPIGQLVNAFEFFREGLFGEGFGKAVDDIKKDFTDLADAAETLGENVGASFNKGFDKAAEARRIKERQALLDFTLLAQKGAADRLAAEQRLAAESAKLAQAQLTEQRDLAEARLRNQLELTQAEINIIRQGDAAAVESLQASLKKRGKLGEENIALLEDFAQKEVDLLSAVRTEQNRQLDEALARRNAQRALEQQALAASVDFNSKLRAEAVKLEQALDEIRVRRAKGEVVFAEEEQRIRIENAQAVAAIEKEKGQTLLGIQKATDDALLEEQVEFYGQLDDLTESELQKAESLADRRAALEVRAEENFRKQVAASRIETAKQLAELDKERKEAELQFGEIDIETIRAFEERKNVIIRDEQRRRVEITNETQNQLLEIQASFAEEERAQLEKQLEYRSLINDAIQLDIDNLLKQANDVTAQLDARQEAAAQAVQKRLFLINEATKIELEQLGLTAEQVKVLQEQGVDALAESFQDLDDVVLQTAANIQGKSVAAIEDATKEGEALIKQLKSRSTQDSLLSAILGTDNENVINNFKAQFNAAFEAAQELTGSFNELLTQLGENQIAELDKQIEENNARFEAQRERNAEQIAAQEESISESLTRIGELEANLAEQNVENRDNVIRAIEKERQRERQLAADKIRLEKEAQAQERAAALQNYEIEKQKAEIQRETAKREKAIAIANAIIQTAVAITRTLAEVPKVDFGISTGILVGLYTAIGAAQIATIASQPLPAVPDPPSPSFAVGGFTASAHSDSKAVGIVHANEYVIPAKMLRKPDVRMKVDQLERQRVRGYQAGGFTSEDQAARQSATETAIITTSLESQTRALESINNNLVNTLDRPSVVSVSEIDEAQENVRNVEARTTF